MGDPADYGRMRVTRPAAAAAAGLTAARALDAVLPTGLWSTAVGNRRANYPSHLRCMSLFRGGLAGIWIYAAALWCLTLTGIGVGPLQLTGVVGLKRSAIRRYH